MIRGGDGVNDHDGYSTAIHSYYSSCGSSGGPSGRAWSDRHNKGNSNVSCPVRHEALILNHQAVNILMSGTGEEEKALRILKYALRRMKDKLAPLPPGTGASIEYRSTTSIVNYEGLQEADSRLQSCCYNDLSPCLVPVSVSETDESTTMTTTNDSSLLFFFYSKVFTFQSSFNNSDDNMTPSCLSSMIDSESLSATIIYNIVVILTMRGLRINNTITLKKALDLFQLSLGLLQHPSQVHHSSMTIRSLALVCWNNSGHIAHLLCDFDHVQTARHMLQTLLTESFSCPTLPVEEEENSAGSLLFLFDEVEIQGFKSNLMFMYPPNTAPAA